MGKYNSDFCWRRERTSGPAKISKRKRAGVYPAHVFILLLSQPGAVPVLNLHHEGAGESVPEPRIYSEVGPERVGLHGAGAQPFLFKKSAIACGFGKTDTGVRFGAGRGNESLPRPTNVHTCGHLPVHLLKKLESGCRFGGATIRTVPCSFRYSQRLGLARISTKSKCPSWAHSKRKGLFLWKVFLYFLYILCITQQNSARPVAPRLIQGGRSFRPGDACQSTLFQIRQRCRFSCAFAQETGKRLPI